MKKYYLSTFGCQMNVHDSEKISGLLLSGDFIETGDPKDADIIIFNTCSIRQKAEQKFYSELGRMKSLKKKNPELKIAVAGCIAQQEGHNILQKTDCVDYVIGPQNIHLFKDITSIPETVAVDDNPYITKVDLPVHRKDSVRAWINIMYGCNNYCSYCIVPYTRGRERSRPMESIINEVKQLAENGCKEATLLGQNVNSYISNSDFAGLLSEINRIDGIRRIRFVTSHPKDLSDGLIHAIRDFEKICKHIHLPLQSGSTKILNLMNRKYSYEEYLVKVNKLKKEIPEIAITSDIIAGFPQESVEDHKETIDALNKIEFDGIFAFKYSKRHGTAASDMEGHLSDDVKSERLYEILELQNKITERKNKQLEGSIKEILIEGRSEKNSSKLTGRTGSNKIVSIPLIDKIKPGDTIKVKITKANKHSLEGITL